MHQDDGNFYSENTSERHGKYAEMKWHSTRPTCVTFSISDKLNKTLFVSIYIKKNRYFTSMSESDNNN